MLRNGGIRQAQQLGQLAETKLAASQRQQHPNPLLIGEGLGDVQDIFHFVISPTNEILYAGGPIGQVPFHLSHPQFGATDSDSSIMAATAAGGLVAILSSMISPMV